MVLQSYKAVYYFSSDLCCNYGEGTFEIKSNRSKKKKLPATLVTFFCNAGDRKRTIF